ncbi:MAG: DUF3226 domain-containing protein [Terracidiphilus sp.]
MAQAQKAELESPGSNYLLVEGIDDWHIHSHLRTCESDFGIGYCGNDESLLDKLSAVIVGSKTTKSILGAVLDADPDTGVAARLESIKNRLQPAYDLPRAFPPEGLILKPRETQPNHDRLPVIGIWLMPDNTRDGILEDLLRLAMPRKSEEYIAQAVDKAKRDGVAGFRDVERSKAIIKTHIAWQDPNMKNLGEALHNHFENLSSALRGFLDWRGRLFGDAHDKIP